MVRGGCGLRLIPGGPATTLKLPAVQVDGAHGPRLALNLSSGPTKDHRQVSVSSGAQRRK